MKQNGKIVEVSDRSAVGIVLLLTGLALVTRLVGLGTWDLIYDEYFTAFFAAERYTSIVNPAYYALTYASILVFGFSEWAVRLPAFLLGVISIPVFYFTWRKIFTNATVLTGALFIVFSTWHLWYSQFGRFYSGVFLFGSLTYYLYYSAIRRDSVTTLVWCIGANVLCILFHLTAVIVPLSCGLFSVLVLLFPSLHEQGYSRRIAIYQLGFYAFMGVLLLPFLWQVLVDWEGMTRLLGYGPLSTILQLLKWTQMPMAVTALAGLYLLLRNEPGKGLFLASGVGVPVVVLLLGSLVTTVRSDYVIFALPLVLLLAGYLCNEASKYLSHLVTAIVLISLSPEFISHYTGRSTLHLGDQAQQIERSFEPGDGVLPLVNLGNAFGYYADFDYPETPLLGDPLDNAVDWKAAMAGYEEHEQCMWIVVPVRRQALAASLEAWLFRHASLISQQSSQRYDYKVEGYQTFVTGQEKDNCVQRFLQANR